MPMPSLKNNSVVLPSVSQSSCKPNFDLRFHLDSDSDDDVPSVAVDFKVPHPVKKMHDEKKKVPPKRCFKEPRSEAEMKRMG